MPTTVAPIPERVLEVAHDMLPTISKTVNLSHSTVPPRRKLVAVPRPEESFQVGWAFGVLYDFGGPKSEEVRKEF